MSENMNNQPRAPKQKRRLNARFLWLISVIAGAAFLITFWLTPVFPLKWTLFVLLGLVIILGLTFLLSIKTNPKNVFTKIVNVILTIALFAGTILIPYEVDKVTGIFNQVSTNTVTINVYRMTDSYMQTNGFTEIFDYDSEDGKVTDLSTLKKATFITSSTQDSDDMTYVLKELNTAFGSAPNNMDRQSFIDAAASLYSHEGDFLIMPEKYEGMLRDNEAYQNFSTDTQIVYSFKRTLETTTTVKGDTTLTKEPFTIFFGGNDETGALDSAIGRTDVCMIVTVNPNTHQVSIINLPRDSYIPNPAYGTGKSSYDKLTHLGLKGIQNTLTGLENYLDEPIKNYVFLNFDTFMNIIIALDGVDIDNPYSFDAIDGQHFDAGQIHLNEDAALMYVRERENLPDGDFGRNMHQQIVMQAIIDKITSAQGILKFNDVLASVKGQFLTNVSSDALYGLVQKQLDENIQWNIVKYHIVGDTGYEICASAPGQQLSVVYPYTNQVEFAKKVIDQIDNGDIVEQEDLPDGSYSKSSTTTSN